MGFPIYFFIVLAVAALLIATVAVYFQVYKRSINRALEINPGTHVPMTPPYKVAILLTIAVLIVGILISYFAGYKAAYDKYEEELSQTSAFDIQTFYAEVKDVGDDTILVEGISLNDESFRGEFRYDVWEATKLEWRNTPISLSDLDNGDLVSITLITDRGGITDLFKIRLLDDER